MRGAHQRLACVGYMALVTWRLHGACYMALVTWRLHGACYMAVTWRLACVGQPEIGDSDRGAMRLEFLNLPEQLSLREARRPAQQLLQRLSARRRRRRVGRWRAAVLIPLDDWNDDVRLSTGKGSNSGLVRAASAGSAQEAAQGERESTGSLHTMRHCTCAHTRWRSSARPRVLSPLHWLPRPFS